LTGTVTETLATGGPAGAEVPQPAAPAPIRAAESTVPTTALDLILVFFFGTPEDPAHCT
jgi:hypothetical protein